MSNRGKRATRGQKTKEAAPTSRKLTFVLPRLAPEPVVAVQNEPEEPVVNQPPSPKPSSVSSDDSVPAAILGPSTNVTTQPEASISVPSSPVPSSDADLSSRAGTTKRPSSVIAETSEDESEIQQVPPPKKAKVAKGAGRKAKEHLPELEDIVMLIPQAQGHSDSTKRKKISASLSFDEALEIIHETIGCADVVRKPELQYKLSDAPKNSSPIGLQAEEDWAGLHEDLLSKSKKNKPAPTVTIIISEQYLKSLRAHQTQGRPAGSGRPTGSKSSKKQHVPVLDLDHIEDDEDLQEGNDGMMEKELQMVKTLKQAHSRCQRCGESKFCKINRNGEYVTLTFQQQRAWALSLVHGTRGVTLHTPPASDLFNDFHGTNKATPLTPAPPAALQSGPSATPMFMPPGPFMMPPWFSMPPAGYGNNFHPYESPMPKRAPKHNHDIPSSDPPEELDAQIEPYPDIEPWITALDKKHPKRGLLKHITEFDSQDYYEVNEIANLSVERLVAFPFSITQGNADFLLREAKKTVEQVKRICNKGKKRREY